MGSQTNQQKAKVRKRQNKLAAIDKARRIRKNKLREKVK